MTADPRAALDRLIAAFEAHLRALEASDGQEDDSAVENAYETLAAAYEAYDEALGETYDESTPLYVEYDYDDDLEADEDDDEIVLVDDEG